MKTSFTKQLLVFLLLVSVLSIAKAQGLEETGKITIEITKDVNGEKKTFKGEYENEAQMRADPNYQEFIDKEGDLSIDFNGFGDTDFSLDIQKMLNQSGFNFSFDPNGPNSFSFGLDTTMIDLNSMSGFSSHMKMLEEHLQGLDFDEETFMNSFFGDSTSSLPKHQQNAFPSQYENEDRKRLEITTIESDEFGKKGRVKESEVLILEKLDYLPNPSWGQFKLRFKVPQQGELSVKVTDINGKGVFSRYFNQFGGFYSESIDLSDQNAGVYLLEIKLDKKRLIRKIVIE